jgi:hypothetical protein
VLEGQLHDRLQDDCDQRVAVLAELEQYLVDLVRVRGVDQRQHEFEDLAAALRVLQDIPEEGDAGAEGGERDVDELVLLI